MVAVVDEVRQAEGVRSRAPVTTPLGLALAMLAVVLTGGVVTVVALVRAGPLGGIPVAYAFPAIGALYVVAGLLAWWRRPANRTGALLVRGGAAWLAASLANTGVAVLIAVGTVTAVLPVSLVLHLLHAAPGGRLRGRASKASVVTGYVVGLVLQAPLWAFRPEPPPYDLVLVAARPELAQAGYRVQQVVGAAVVAVTVWVLARRLREYEPAQRWVLAPLFGYGVLAVLAVPVVADVLRPLLGLGQEASAALQLTALATVPLGFLGVVLRGGFARTGELSAFVTSVAASSGSRRELEDAVAATLGDPSATLLHWSAEEGGYVDTTGQVVPLPPTGGARAAVHVEVGDQRLAAVLYDTRLDTDPAAVAAWGGSRRSPSTASASPGRSPRAGARSGTRRRGCSPTATASGGGSRRTCMTGCRCPSYGCPSRRTVSRRTRTARRAVSRRGLRRRSTTPPAPCAPSSTA